MLSCNDTSRSFRFTGSDSWCDGVDGNNV